MAATSNDSAIDDFNTIVLHAVEKPCLLPSKSCVLAELREQIKTAFPTLATLIISVLPWLISLRFAGALGGEELAAAALATTICNVTGLSLSIGLSSALSTLAGQARGDLKYRHDALKTQKPTEVDVRKSDIDSEEKVYLLSNHTKVIDKDSEDKTLSIDSDLFSSDSRLPLLPLVYLYRAIFVQILFVIPVGIWWLTGIGPVLIALGQGEHLSIMAQDYLRILTPGLWSYSINWTITAWLQAMEMSDISACVSTVGLVLHIPMNIFFVHILQWNFLGCAAATTTFQFFQPLLNTAYLLVLPFGRKRLLKNMYADAISRTSISFFLEARQALDVHGICVYLSLAIPGVIVISEWWASETVIFLSGRLQPMPDLSLGAMTLYQSINSFCFMFPMACSVAGATRVANLLGSGDTSKTRLAAHLSIACALMVSCVIALILYFSPHTFFPGLFAPNEHNLVHETSRTISLLALYVIGDSLQCAFNGIAKGCGRQVITMPIVIVAYWIIGLPLAYYIAFVKYDGNSCQNDKNWCGVVGLVVGITTGTWVHAILLGIAVVGTTNWTAEVLRAKNRLDFTHEITQKELIAQTI